MTDAVFHLDGERHVPTELARGPWDPGAQHGGAAAAILGRAVERFQPELGLAVTRITFELLRPVPLAPLVVTTAMTRPGKRVQLVTASLRAVVYARALGFRETKAVSFAFDEGDARRIERDWQRFPTGVPLEVVEAPFRDVGKPLLTYLRRKILAAPRKGDSRSQVNSCILAIRRIATCVCPMGRLRPAEMSRAAGRKSDEGWHCNAIRAFTIRATSTTPAASALS